MALSDETLGTQAAAENIEFQCPACPEILSVPAALAGVEGPCPRCAALITAPVPSVQLPARLIEGGAVEANQRPGVASPDPAAAAQGVPMPNVVPDSPAVAETSAETGASEQRLVACSACDCELAIDPALAHLPGGPCPSCGTWIDLQGKTPEEGMGAADLMGGAAIDGMESLDAPVREPFPPERHDLPSKDDPREAASPSGIEELNQSAVAEAGVSGQAPPRSEVGGMNFRKLEPQQTIERRKVRKRKKRGKLPPEFYVGHAAGDLDARGQETADRMRRHAFPGERRREEASTVEEERFSEGPETPWRRCVPLVLGVVVPLLGGLYAALHFRFIEPSDLNVLEANSSVVEGTPFDPLAESLGRTEQELKGKARESYQSIEAAVRGFISAGSWDEAQAHLSWTQMPEVSEAGAFLRLFPREDFRRAEIRVIDADRIPETERFVFTLHVSDGPELRLMRVALASEVIDAGRSLIVLAKEGTDYHLKVFDGSGVAVFERSGDALRGSEGWAGLGMALSSVDFDDLTSVSKEQRRELMQEALGLAGLEEERHLAFMVGEDKLTEPRSCTPSRSIRAGRVP